MKKITIVAFGDSITHDRHVEKEEDRWLSVLGRLLSAEYPGLEFNMINAGVGGNSDREKMARYETDVLAHNPDILLVQFGGNNPGYDKPERFTPVEETITYLQRIKETAPARTSIVVITFPCVLWRKHGLYLRDGEKFIEFFKKDGGHEASLETYRNACREFASENGYPVVELNRAMEEHGDIESLQVGDGVHLNKQGDRFFAELVFDTVKALPCLRAD